MSGLANVRDVARRDLVHDRTVRRVIGVAAFAAATAFGARIALPVPGTPVPFTLQVVFVLMAGALLGARLGAASQALYLAVGLLGAPVFAAGGGWAYLLGPTGGYLLAMPAAAWTVGAVAGRSMGPWRLALGLTAGLAVLHAGGAAWLWTLTGDPGVAARFGIVPFLAFDVVKIILALIACHKLRFRALELF